MKDVDYFCGELLSAKMNPRPGYGGNVLPALELFAQLKTPKEKKAYQEALERILQSGEADIRSYAVNVCIGFFVFRDAIHDSKR